MRARHGVPIPVTDGRFRWGRSGWRRSRERLVEFGWGGADLAWAQDVHGEMVGAGLAEVATITHSQSWPGGSPGASLYETNSRRLEPQLLDAGLSPGQLDGFRRLQRDPAFGVMSYQFVSTRGRRPVAWSYP
ncbi:hypothetical protein AB0H57_19295 [Micromonospora sp. NPDC050686]|uniref:hypothetical protein n=1 Tax=Micromonospora sp. NPDC050686 TaxID=3154631 RepID=UPI00340931C2